MSHFPLATPWADDDLSVYYERPPRRHGRHYYFSHFIEILPLITCRALSQIPPHAGCRRFVRVNAIYAEDDALRENASYSHTTTRAFHPEKLIQ